jgi:catechol 2,3-dioxygenase-like lactoylglutathione lyase family enzyme
MTQAGRTAKSIGPALAAADAMATIGVRDIRKARDFYEGVLGMEGPERQDGEVITYTSGGSQLLIYESKYAGTNKATAITWVIHDVDGVVADLARRGVVFEHYDMPGMTRKGDVHVWDGTRAAWFKDPDGNILALVSP